MGRRAATAELTGGRASVADVFPILPDDELAADIKARGLDHPIVVDDQDRVLDGRNRLAACELAGVEPTFETYKGNDPDAYALANNIHRRHLTTGQRALAVARAVQVVQGDQSELARRHQLPRPRVVEAQVILDHAPHLADAVMDGTEPFASAVEYAAALLRCRQHIGVPGVQPNSRS